MVFTHARDASAYVASQIALLIRERAKKNENCVLGLATGSTPVSIYNELIRLHKNEGLSFQNVVTFNLDEYYPMQPESLQSYVRFMREHLFDHIDIEPVNVHVPDVAKAVEAAVEAVLDAGLRTGDVMSDGKTLVSTAEMGGAVLAELDKRVG